jgi:multiple sugar transport system substrate-binding protein
VAAGCSSSGSSSAGDGDGTHASGAVKLTAWTPNSQWVAGLKAAADAYNKTGKKLTLDVQYIDQENGVYASKVAAATRTNTLPDLLTVNGADQWSYVGAGEFKKLNGIMDATLTNFPQSVVGNYIKYSETNKKVCDANKDCTYKDVQVGDYYTFPQISGGTGYFFVNKSLLTQAGLDPSHVPATWSELVQEIQASHDKLGDTGGLIMPLQLPESGWLWFFRPLLFTQLGPDKTMALFSDKSGQAWRDPAVLNTLKLYDQLSPLWVPSVLQDSIDVGDDLFSGGKATWYLGGTYSLSGLVQKGMDPDNLLIFPIPTAPGGALDKLEILPWASGFIGISKSTKNESAAEDFLKFYMSQPGAEAFATAVHDAPAVSVPESSDNPMAAAEKASFSDGPNAFSDFTIYGPTCDGASTLNHQASVALTQLIGGHTTPDKLAQQLAGLYKKAWSACG